MRPRLAPAGAGWSDIRSSPVSRVRLALKERAGRRGPARDSRGDAAGRSAPPDETDQHQQNHRADGGVDDSGDDTAADDDAEPRQQETGDQGADDADDDVAD